jgi:hypothetical protein
VKTVAIKAPHVSPDETHVDEAIERFINGTTTSKDSLTSVFVGTHVCVLLWKGHTSYMGRGRSAYFRSELRLVEFRHNLGNERGEIHFELHPEGCKLTKKVMEEALKKARQYDAGYLDEINKREKNAELKEDEWNTRVRWANLFAEGIGLKGDFECRRLEGDDYLEYVDDVTVKEPAIIILGENKARMTVEVEVMFDMRTNPCVRIHLHSPTSVINSTFYETTPNKVREWLKKVGVK